MPDNEKDFDEEKKTDLSEDITENDDNLSADESQQSNENSVHFENNDNWEFEAQAPTLDDSAFLENDNFVIDKDEFDKTVKNVPAEQNQNVPQTADNQIVINRDSLKLVPVAVFTVLVLIALIVLGVRYYTVPNGKEGDLINPPSIAATIDGEKVSVGMYNYYYASVVNYYEQYAMYGYFDLDTTKSYEKQYTVDEDGNEITWAQFFQNEALREIELNYVYYTKGLKEGITLTQNQKDTIETQIESLKASASDQEMSLNDYISENFGEYCSEDTVRLMLEQYYIAVNYKGKFAINYKPSDEEINEFFDENRNDYNQISFSYIATEYDATDDESKAQSQKVIDDYMDRITDRDSILAMVPEVYADYIQTDMETAMSSDSSLTEEEAREDAIANYQANIDSSITGASSPFSDEITQWLFSDDTEIGEKNYYVDEENSYAYIILKTEMASLDESDTYSVRHILIMPESDDETSDSSSDSSEEPKYTDEQWAAAEEKANSILDEFNSGDRSEYSFALLAELNSDDVASTSSGANGLYGGLYEGVPLGQMVSEFEDWSMDRSRKYGDTGIVKSTHGYHIMFFVDASPSYMAQLKNDMKTEKLNEMIENASVNLHDGVINKAIEKYNDAKSEAADSSTSNTVS